MRVHYYQDNIAKLIKEIKPVRVIIGEMVAEAEALIGSLRNIYKED